MIALDEELITLAEAARLIPSVGGRRPATTTLWRWATIGIGGERLEVVRIGRRIATSREALQRFLNRPVSPAWRGRCKASPESPRPCSTATHERILAGIEAKLEREGL